METQTDLRHTICGACRISWLRNNVIVHKGDKEPKKERCCRCGYMTVYGVTVSRSHDEFYCQRKKIHETTP